MNKTARRILVGGLVLLALLVGGLWLRRAHSKDALNEYKAELRAKGEKLTMGELVTTYSSNGIPGTLRLLSAARNLPKAPVVAGNIAIMDYVRPGEARVAWAGEELHWYAHYSPPTTNGWPTAISQIQNASDDLKQIREALKNPDPDLGWDQKNFNNRPTNDFVAKRTAAQWLAAATLIELHEGRLDSTLENLRALIAMSQLHREELTLVNQMIRIAIAGLGTATTWEVLRTNAWSDEQLAQMQTDWQKVDLLDAMEKGFLGDRAWIVAQMDSLSIMMTNSRAKGVLSWVWSPERDEMFFLQHMQSTLESIRSLKTNKPWPEIKIQFDKNQANIDNLSDSIFKYRYLFSLIVIPNVSRATTTALKNETQRRLAIAGIALKRYQIHHRQFPPSLAALVPDYLPAQPVDCMSGQPLQYRLNANGSFLLYSVGLDGKDDGGNPTPLVSTNKFGLWEGRDAVWPVASTNEPAKVR